MAFETDRGAYSRPYSVGQAGAAEIDAGLRRYMLQVYNYMASGLFLSGLVAMLVANTGARSLFFQATERGYGPTGLGWLSILAPIGIILAMSFGASRMKASTLKVLYWAFVATMGVGLSNALLMYTGVSVTRVFFITATAFGSLSLYGYLTKRDLSAFGTFLFMGLIGLMIAGIVQMFVHSAALQFVYSAVGVLLFSGMTAYDTQRIKNNYLQMGGTDHSAIMGAVAIYLDFINLFQFLLQFMGVRRD